jgi:hypothetical protein
MRARHAASVPAGLRGGNHPSPVGPPPFGPLTSGDDRPVVASAMSVWASACLVPATCGADSRYNASPTLLRFGRADQRHASPALCWAWGQRMPPPIRIKPRLFSPLLAGEGRGEGHLRAVHRPLKPSPYPSPGGRGNRGWAFYHALCMLNLMRMGQRMPPPTVICNPLQDQSNSPWIC